MVEGAVRLVYQRIFFPIRNMTFFSLDELNCQLQKELVTYNEYLMVTYQASRRKLFVELEEQYLRLMVRHHEGAIKASDAEIAAGKYTPAIELAKTIKAAQALEIIEMKALLAAL